jgi:hypothetical protein
MLLTEMPNVYEADFKGFFDSIDIEGLSEVLKQDLGIPIGEAKFIELLNKSVPKLTEKDKIPEPSRNVFQDGHGNLNPNLKAHRSEEPFLVKLLSNKDLPTSGSYLVRDPETDSITRVVYTPGNPTPTIKPIKLKEG